MAQIDPLGIPQKPYRSSPKIPQKTSLSPKIPKNLGPPLPPPPLDFTFLGGFYPYAQSATLGQI